MKLRRAAVLAAGAILLVVVIQGVLFAQTNLTNTDIVIAEDMLRGVRDAVKKNYYDPRYHGVDLDGRYKLYEEKIKKAPNRGAAFAEIAAYLSALHDSHTIFIPPPRLAAYHYGFRMAIVGDGAYITEVRPGSDAEEKLHPGDEILGLNHYTVNRNDFQDLSYYLYALSPQTAVNFSLRDPLGRPREVSVETRIEGEGISGGEQRLWGEISNNRDVMGHSLRQRWVEQGDLLIWKMPEFSMDDSEVDHMMDKARKHGAVILDLRGNPGGRVTTLDRMVGDVMDREVTVASRVSRKPEKPDTAKSRASDTFRGKLFVLVDSRSESASEVFARTMQLEHRGIIVGDRTAGAVMQARIYPEHVGINGIIPYAVEITNANLIMSDGKSLEGVGVTPDVIVLPTGADLAAGRDPALAKAAELAGVKLDPAAAGKLFPFEWQPLSAK